MEAFRVGSTMKTLSVLQEVGDYASDLIKQNFKSYHIHKFSKGAVILSKHKIIKKDWLNLGQRQILVCGLILKWILIPSGFTAFTCKATALRKPPTMCSTAIILIRIRPGRVSWVYWKDTANITEHRSVQAKTVQRTHIAEPIPGIGVRRFQRCTYVIHLRAHQWTVGGCI